MIFASRMRSSSFRFVMARWTNAGLLMIPLFNSRPGPLNFGDVKEDASTDGDLPPDILDRIDCESSDTVFSLWIDSTVCMLVTIPVDIVCAWFMTSNDSFVRSETRRFLIGWLLLVAVVGLRLLFSFGVFCPLTLFRDRWQNIWRHNSGWSRQNRSWWNAPVSGPRVTWRKPLLIQQTTIELIER